MPKHLNIYQLALYWDTISLEWNARSEDGALLLSGMMLAERLADLGIGDPSVLTDEEIAGLAGATPLEVRSRLAHAFGKR